jgi:kynurenine formamidase
MSSAPARRIIDLSQPLSTSGGSYCPGHPRFDCKPVTTMAEDGWNVSQLSLGSHTGTHIDAPLHYIPGGASTSEVDLSALVGPAVVVDVRGRGPREWITWGDFAGCEEQLQPGVIVLLCTGWSRYWKQENYPDNPRLNKESAERLVGRGIRVVGIDALSSDGTPEEGETLEFNVHLQILGNGGVLAENLTNLESLLGMESPMVSLLPLNLDGCDGSPIRAVAWSAADGG